MFRVLLPAIGLLGLVAFTARTESPVIEIQSDVAPMAWHLSHEGDMAKLAYGVANSDQLALMMTCAPGDRAAVVYGDVQPDSARLVQASSGPAEPDPMSGGDAFETRIALNDSALRALASTGRMAVTGEGGKFSLAADAGERRLVASFLGHCASGRA